VAVLNIEGFFWGWAGVGLRVFPGQAPEESASFPSVPDVWVRKLNPDTLTWPLFPDLRMPRAATRSTMAGARNKKASPRLRRTSGLPAFRPSAGFIQTSNAHQGLPDGRLDIRTLAQTYSSAESARSTMGAKRLNFCVRDGNRWTLLLYAPRKIVQSDHIRLCDDKRPAAPRGPWPLS
jgi:hypothetical protein